MKNEGVIMETTENKQEVYSIPFIVNSSYKLGMNILFLFLIAMFIGFSLIPFDGIEGLIYRALCTLLWIFFVYTWLYMGVFRKAYVELSEDGITLKTVFSLKFLKWTDIVDVQTFYMNRNSFIGITSKQKLEKRKDSFFTLISTLFGGNYSLSIPLKSFSKINAEKLYSTIFFTAQEKWKQKDIEQKLVNEPLNVNDTKDTQQNNLLIALFITFLTSIFVGIIYGLTIYAFRINILLIPVFGMMGIFYVYFRNYRQGTFNIVSRLFIGVFCALQFFIALLVELLMLNWDLIKMNGFKTVLDCIDYIYKYPDKYISFYAFGTICFFIGITYGYSFKFIRKIKKLFLLKRNGFCVERDKRYITIYLIDYVGYDKKINNSIIQINPGVCMIEKEKKNIYAFYIPEEIMNEFNIMPNGLERVCLDEKNYYKLDLGNQSEPKIYGYTSSLVLNQNNQIELIQLEIDLNEND
jgi:hypothetical protein